MNIKSFWGKYNFTIILLAIMIIAAIVVLSLGKPSISGVPHLDSAMMIVLIVVGLAAGLLGGWIGTGGCSVMLPKGVMEYISDDEVKRAKELIVKSILEE